MSDLPFKRYHSIENSYQTKVIEHFRDQCPEIDDHKYCVQEKIDGANFQIHIDKDGYTCGKRNGPLEPGDDFYGWEEVVEMYEIEIRNFWLYYCRVHFNPVSRLTLLSIVLYCELYGKGIQNRIDYGYSKKICVYDIRVSYDSSSYGLDPQLAMRSSVNMLSDFADMRIDHLETKYLAFDLSLQEALDFDVESYRVGDRPIEGVVIKPQYINIYDNHGARFILKKKSTSFKDKAREKKVFVDQRSDECKELCNTAISYLEANRVMDYIGKVGPISEPKQIGFYVKGITEDARADFLKDHEASFESLSKEGRSALLKAMGREAGKVIVPLLKEMM